MRYNYNIMLCHVKYLTRVVCMYVSIVRVTGWVVAVLWSFILPRLGELDTETAKSTGCGAVQCSARVLRATSTVRLFII